MTAPARASAGVVQVSLPIPPKVLGKGASVHWRTVRRHYRDGREIGYMMLMLVMQRVGVVCGENAPWGAARMDIHWQYALGRAPDSDNIVTRCACYRDAAEDAGLVFDDRHISIGTVTTERVQRGYEVVQVTFSRITEGQDDVAEREDGRQ